MQVTQAVRLVRPLAEGGMGKVWIAEHTVLKTQVVVKFLAKDLANDAEAAERFKREAAVAAAVKNPHVVQVIDYGVLPDGPPYIVMEHLEGRDLDEHLQKHGRMNAADVAAMVAQVAKGLAKAHEKGVVHRDIKPSNIFLCDAGGGEMFVKLLDFGVAKQTQEATSKTTTGTVVGTPHYMSPEQIVADREIDLRTDVWALGVVAYQALTGKLPFDGTTVGAITLAIHRPPPRISAVLPDLPTAIDDWFLRICAHEPEQRYQTAREASMALHKALSGVSLVPVLLAEPAPADSKRAALPSSAVVTTRRKKPRTAMIVLAAVAVLGLVAVGLMVLTK